MRPLRLLLLTAAAGSLIATRGAAQAAAQAAVPSAPPVAPSVPTRPAETLIGTGPNGATMRCRDGSYPSPNAADAACDANGGVLVRFPVRRIPARVTARPARVAAPAPPAITTDAPATTPAFENRAKVFVPAQTAPAGTTFQCVDGSYIVADTVRSRCATRGGVRVTFPAKPRG